MKNKSNTNLLKNTADALLNDDFLKKNTKALAISEKYNCILNVAQSIPQLQFETQVT